MTRLPPSSTPSGHSEELKEHAPVSNPFADKNYYLEREDLAHRLGVQLATEWAHLGGD